MVNKKEQKARNIALAILGLMVVIWTVFGIWSFTDREGYDRPLTTEVKFIDQTALRGKQVFQAYNCMGCHTIVGNGAYFAPDLTDIYKNTGPAWLSAYLGSPGTYPTEAIVNIQLKELIKMGETDISTLGVKDLKEYYTEFPYTESRIVERGGIKALMPNLQFTKDEINALIAFFKYTGKINTAGWPPEIIAKESIIEKKKIELEEKSGIYRTKETPEPKSEKNNTSSKMSSVEIGKKLSNDLGCIACHSVDGSKAVGPSWQNLYGSSVELTGGKTVQADSAYLRVAILQADQEIVEGYQARVMPTYDGYLSDEDLNNIIDYIKSLK